MNTLADPIETEVEGQGRLEAGFLFASFKNIGMGNVTVNGVTLTPGEAKGYPFVGKAYNTISYDTGESTLRILQIL